MRSATIILIVATAQACRAQAPPPAATAAPVIATPGCYEIVMPEKEQPPYGPILLNKCTSETWLLTKDSVGDAKGKLTGAFVFRWHQLSAVTGEAILQFPSPYGQR